MEWRDAIAFYDRESRTIGSALAEAVGAAIAFVREHPEAGRPIGACFAVGRYAGFHTLCSTGMSRSGSTFLLSPINAVNLATGFTASDT